MDLPGLRYGTLPVRMSLMTASGDTLAAVEFSHHLERDHSHWISASVGPERRLGFCIGFPMATPLRTAPQDTLFVYAGSLPDGAIC